MFYQGIKQRKSVFYFVLLFLPHFLYTMKQIKKPKPCIAMWQKTPIIREHSRNVENTRFYISFVFSKTCLVLSQCNNTQLGLLYLRDFRNGFLFIVWRLISAHGPSRFLFYANVINSCLFGISFPIVSDTSSSFFADAGHRAPQMRENDGGIK